VMCHVARRKRSPGGPDHVCGMGRAQPSGLRRFGQPPPWASKQQDESKAESGA